MQIYNILFSCLLCFLTACGSGPETGNNALQSMDTAHQSGPVAPDLQAETPEATSKIPLAEFEYDTLASPIPTYTRYMPKVNIGAEVLIHRHLDKLKGKRVAIVANHTTRVFDGKHLVDTLINRGIQVTKIFAPEHGFRGTADAGETIKSGIDKQTGLPVYSLHGKHKKPTPAYLSELDLVIFDIQDLGTRFYTYISTMTYVMEACAENNISIMVLDRPNPNGWYVDGPVLEPQFKSFIGMHTIPTVHGMTVGEYAKMVNGEGWLENEVAADLTVIPVEKYTHSMRWEDTGLGWIPPSPNIPTEYAAYLYAAICWFEPTEVSVGRGTDEAFTMLGAPWFTGSSFLTPKAVNPAPQMLFNLEVEPFNFLPRSLPGKSKYPKHQDKLCKGITFKGKVEGKELFLAGIQLMKNFYAEYQENPSDKPFFHKGFGKWPGNAAFQKQIVDDVSAEDIYESWQEKTDEYRVMRKRYLMYDDF